MAITPLQTPETDPTSVSRRLTGLLAKDNPLMQQARTTGLQIANRRGLLNSSIAVGAAQNQMIRAALPIASQEASQAAAKELTGMTTGSQERIAGRGTESQERIAALATGSQERIAAVGTESRERIAGQSVASQEFIATLGLDTQRDIAALDVASREEIARLGVGSQERIAALNVAAHDRQFAISALTVLEQKYGQMWTEIVKNKDIPADARENYFQHIAALRDSDMALVEQLYNIDIDWASPVATAKKPGAPASTAPPPASIVGKVLQRFGNVDLFPGSTGAFPGDPGGD